MFESQYLEAPVLSTKMRHSGIGFVQGIAVCEQDPNEFISKQALCRLFECSGRTIQRMVARCDLPPPVTMAGRKYWEAKTLGKWLADAGKRRQAEIDENARLIRSIMADRWDNYTAST